MNCIVIEDDSLSSKLMEQFINKTSALQLINSFSNPVDALAFMPGNKVDLIFLDIEMPEMNGMEFISSIKIRQPHIILTTSHTEFALDAFEYNVTDYLMKPITYSRFYKAILKVQQSSEKNLKQEESKHDDGTLFIKSGTSLIRLKKSDILWVEALGDYVVLNTSTNKFVVHFTMKDMEERLSSKEYIRVHRSYIVRIDKIDTIEDNAISYNDKLIPISKSYREAVLDRLNML